MGLCLYHCGASQVTTGTTGGGMGTNPVFKSWFPMLLDITLMGKQLLCNGVVAVLLTAQDKVHCSTHTTHPKQCPVLSQPWDRFRYCGIIPHAKP